MIIVTVRSRLEVGPIRRIPGHVLRQLRDRLTFPNPSYLEAERRGFYTGHLPRELCFLEERKSGLVIPRGFTRQLLGVLKSAGVRYLLDDHRRTLPRLTSLSTVTCGGIGLQQGCRPLLKMRGSEDRGR